MTTSILSAAVAWQVKAHAFERALHEVRAVIATAEARANPNWHLQPRLPRGHPDGGQWTREGDAEVVPVAFPPSMYDRLAALVPRIKPYLRRLPRLVARGVRFLPPLMPLERMRLPSAQRPGHEYMEFDNWYEFKRVFGPADPGYHWHHIVEQRLVWMGRFSPRQIYNTDNTVMVPEDIHLCVSAAMSESYEDALGRPYDVGWKIRISKLSTTMAFLY
ncbi:MAG: hypothetical protein CMM50_18630 [Rhodospirillaceae bacterium]|nr:hypothetical protein [Rhodospirillaceae bacterium]